MHLSGLECVHAPPAAIAFTHKWMKKWHRKNKYINFKSEKVKIVPYCIRVLEPEVITVLNILWLQHLYTVIEYINIMYSMTWLKRRIHKKDTKIEKHITILKQSKTSQLTLASFGNVTRVWSHIGLKGNKWRLLGWDLSQAGWCFWCWMNGLNSDGKDQKTLSHNIPTRHRWPVIKLSMAAITFYYAHGYLHSCRV